MDRMIGKLLHVGLLALADVAAVPTSTPATRLGTVVSLPRRLADVRHLQGTFFRPRFDVHIWHPHSLISLFWQHRGPSARPENFFSSASLRLQISVIHTSSSATGLPHCTSAAASTLPACLSAASLPQCHHHHYRLPHRHPLLHCHPLCHCPSPVPTELLHKLIVSWKIGLNTCRG